MFKKLWQFSSYILQKSLKIYNANNFLKVNTEFADKDTQHIFLRAVHKSKLEYITQMIDGNNYKAVKVKDMIYIPNKKELQIFLI